MHAQPARLLIFAGQVGIHRRPRGRIKAVDIVIDNAADNGISVAAQHDVNHGISAIIVLEAVGEYFLDRKIDFDEIAETKSMTYDALLKEIENICFSGTKLNIDYYIEQVMDDDRQDDIYDYFMTAESDSLEDAMSELDEDYSEDEVRLMRIKFMSEHAH